MNEQGTAQADAAQTPAGALLRQAREHAGLQVETLAAMLKVPVERLQALEQGRYEALPDITFARALALSVCRALKVDPTAVLAQMPLGPAPNLGPSRDAIDTPMPRARETSGFSTGSALGRRAPLLIALGLLLLAIVLWFVLPANGDAPVVPSGASDALETPLLPAPAADNPAASALANTPTAEPASSSAVEAPSETANATAAEPLATPEPTAASSATDASVVELRVKDTSWVQVIGASGRIWLQRNLEPGEAVRFDQDLPLAVTVGRADATTVWVRGQPFDLSSVTRNNVARFEIR